MVPAVPVGVCLSRRRLCRGGRADACGCSYLGPGKGRPQAHGVWGAGGGWLAFWQGHWHKEVLPSPFTSGLH